MDEGCGETIYVLGVGSGEKLRLEPRDSFYYIFFFFKNTHQLVSHTLSDGEDYGLNESDMQASVATVRSMCEQIEADLILLRERAEAGGQVRDYLIRRRVGEADFLEVR